MFDWKNYLIIFLIDTRKNKYFSYYRVTINCPQKASSPKLQTAERKKSWKMHQIFHRNISLFQIYFCKSMIST